MEFAICLYLQFVNMFGCFVCFSKGGNTSSEMMEADQTKIQMFLHRLSVVHAQVKILFVATT